MVKERCKADVEVSQIHSWDSLKKKTGAPLDYEAGALGSVIKSRALNAPPDTTSGHPKSSVKRKDVRHILTDLREIIDEAHLYTFSLRKQGRTSKTVLVHMPMEPGSQVQRPLVQFKGPEVWGGNR